MSALARFFKKRGDTVSGYDRTRSPLTEELESEGIAVHYDDNPMQIPADVDMVVYTPAVPQDLHEFVALRERGVKIEKRSQVLGELKVLLRFVIVVERLLSLFLKRRVGLRKACVRGVELCL